MCTESLKKTRVKSLHLKNIAQGFYIYIFYIFICFQGNLMVRSMTSFKVFYDTVFRVLFVQNTFLFFYLTRLPAFQMFCKCIVSICSLDGIILIDSKKEGKFFKTGNCFLSYLIKKKQLGYFFKVSKTLKISFVIRYYFFSLSVECFNNFYLVTVIQYSYKCFT